MSSTPVDTFTQPATGFPTPVDNAENSLVLFTQLYLHPAASRLFERFSSPEDVADLHGLLSWIRGEFFKRDCTITQLSDQGFEHYNSARAWHDYSQRLEHQNEKLAMEISDLRKDRQASGYPDYLATQAQLIRERQLVAQGLACYAQADVQPFLEAMMDDSYSLFLFVEELHDKASAEGDRTWYKRISSVLAMTSTLQDQLGYTSDEMYGALQEFKEEVSDPVVLASEFSGVTYSNSWEISPDFPRICDLPSPLSSTDSLAVSMHSPVTSCLDLD
ncbi:hypothetical protein BDP27DRAFT_1440660 [Rhodocollybia butyracea]|uniref:Uncharacterized protein n=1 Tax=Rhodocollybia butyracea TaxID=206335 RepID=A0A9P5TVI7_9AGAR|nr:hypothetical protein BDP27DRAFT_1440660 [Rhodocollybia butyracea]